MTGLLGALFAGVFLFNAIPHIVRGICGSPHMTPFGRSSSAAVNVVWGWVNLLITGLVVWLCHPAWTVGTWIAFGIGGLAISLGLAIFWSNPEARLPWHKK